MDKLFIRGAVIVDPLNEAASSLPDSDILVVDGRVEEVGRDLSDIDAEILEADGLCCAPGLVDMHVHLRDPGQTDKEDILSGCRAAAAGGVTSLACMPNTQPVCDSPDIISYILKKAQAADARVYPVAAVTHSLGGERMTDFAALKSAGAVAVSDDGRPVPTAGGMLDAMRLAAETGLPILSHCEEMSLTRGGIINEGEVSHTLGIPGIHPAAEEAATAREIALAAATGCPVHICHVSTKGSVELLRDARRRGVPVTGETAPHYFSLTDDLLKGRDADYRMNPPLRTPVDVRAVIEGLCDGTLSAIATDHAPHTPEDKADFLKAPNGSVGMETSLAAGITFLVREGHLSLNRLIQLMSAEPARLLGIPGGTLRKGVVADLVLFDPNERWTVDEKRLHGKSQNCPFKGMTLYGRVKYTLLGGRLVYTDQ